MGLIKSHTTDTGITLSNAYFRISQVELHLRLIGTETEPAKRLSIELEGFADKASRDAGKDPFCSYRYYVNHFDFPTYFSYTLQDQAGVNIVSLSYNYLKTLTEYSTATNG